jgi:hypothetical protein
MYQSLGECATAHFMPCYFDRDVLAFGRDGGEIGHLNRQQTNTLSPSFSSLHIGYPKTQQIDSNNINNMAEEESQSLLLRTQPHLMPQDAENVDPTKLTALSPEVVRSTYAHAPYSAHPKFPPMASFSCQILLLSTTVVPLSCICVFVSAVCVCVVGWVL